MRSPNALAASILAGAVAAAPPASLGASHSDAPLIKQDPQANITDVYAFIGNRYDDPNAKVLNVLVQFRPFSEPGDGVIYDRFADDARYSVHLTNPFTGDTKIRYDFEFSKVNPVLTPGLRNRNTIIAYGVGDDVGAIEDIRDTTRNYLQSYRVRRTVNGITTRIGSFLPTPPPNVGANVTPDYNDPATGRAVSGAGSFSELDRLTRQAIQDLDTGEASFAGPREDGFYADIPGIFDLLDGRIIDNDGDPGDGLGQDGGGVDGFKGYNVLAYGLQIPVESLQDVPGFPFVGVYASVSRQRVTIRTPTGPRSAGPFVQVNRMGNPLFNEAFVPLADKDRYNLTSPTSDDSDFSIYAEEPELATLINTVFGTSFPETGRTVLRSIYTPDVLKVDTSTDPVSLPGDPSFRRLSFIDGDLVRNADGFDVPAGWPNGRRPGDDVIDIALTALASGPDFQTITKVGDNVDANDQRYNRVFPYLGTPHAGTANSKDSIPSTTPIVTPSFSTPSLGAPSPGAPSVQAPSIGVQSIGRPSVPATL